MVRNKRYRSRKHLFINLNSIGLLVSNVLIIAIIIIGFSKLQQLTILQRFVAEYGFYGQSLSLTKDQHFIHRYFGCSQSRGINRGIYAIRNDTLILQLEGEMQRAILSESYLVKGSKLIPTDSSQIFTSVRQYGYW